MQCNLEKKKFHDQNLSLEQLKQLSQGEGRPAAEHSSSSSDLHQTQQISMLQQVRNKYSKFNVIVLFY